MNDTQEIRQPIVNAENVIIGDESSRLSSIIFLLLCVVPMFTAVMFGGVDNMTWVIISVFWAAIILLWLAETWKGRGFLFNPSSLQIPIIGLITIGLVQLLPLGGDSGAEGLSGQQTSQALSLEPYATRFFAIRLVVYLVFFAGCLAFINNEKRLKKAVLMVIVFGAAMAFFGVLQRLANPDGIYGFRDTPQAKPFGPFVNQHHFAAFMQLTGGLTLSLLFGKNISREKQIMLATAIIIMGVAVVLTSSRGGILGFVAVFLFIILVNFLSGRWMGERRSQAERSTVQRKIGTALAGVTLIIMILGVVLFVGGDDSLLRGIGVANSNVDISSGRLHFWPIAIRIFLDHPFIGAGFDAFGVAFTKYDTWSGALRVEQAHNEYLQTLADSGLAGFACIAGFIYLLFRKGLRTISDAKGLRREAAIGALAGCFGILIHSFFDFPLRTPSNAFFFLLLCAVATVPIKSSRFASAP